MAYSDCGISPERGVLMFFSSRSAAYRWRNGSPTLHVSCDNWGRWYIWR